MFYSLFFQWILLFLRCWFHSDYTNYASLYELPEANLASQPDETVDKGIDWLLKEGRISLGQRYGSNTAFISAISLPSSLLPFLSPFGQTLPRSLSIWITLHCVHSGNSRWNKTLLILSATAVRKNRRTDIKLEVISCIWSFLWLPYLPILEVDLVGTV